MVTAVPSELRRREGETDDAYHDRISLYFQDQTSFDSAQDRWEAQLEGFLNQIADHFRTTLGVTDVHVDTRTFMPRRRDANALYTYTSFGYPLYGYDPTFDLAYLMMWDTIWAEHDLRMRNVYYGDYGAPYLFIDDGGWGYNDAYQYDTTHPVVGPMDGSDSGGGGWINNAADFSSDSGGGGDITGAVGSDSGGGGWLSSIGDFSSDSGGGGDVGGSSGGDSGGSTCGGSSCSSSSCSSCGGGGCNS